MSSQGIFLVPTLRQGPLVNFVADHGFRGPQPSVQCCAHGASMPIACLFDSQNSLLLICHSRLANEDLIKFMSPGASNRSLRYLHQCCTLRLYALKYLQEIRFPSSADNPAMDPYSDPMPYSTYPGDDEYSVHSPLDENPPPLPPQIPVSILSFT